MIGIDENTGRPIFPPLVEAFLAGAKWWEYESTGATMWGSGQGRVLEEALRRYPVPEVAP